MYERIFQQIADATTPVTPKTATTAAWVSKENAAIIAQSIKIGRSVWMYGPTGTGKSTIAAEIIKSLIGTDALRVQGHSSFESQDWYGGVTVSEKGTLDIVYSPVITAMESGTPCIVEEYNMIRPENKGPLFSIMDDTRYVDVIINGTTRRVAKAPGFCLVVTSNDNGCGDNLTSYVGGDIENRALLSRFTHIHIPYLSAEHELGMVMSKVPNGTPKKYVKDIIHIATETRRLAADGSGKEDIAMSPRSIIDWVTLRMMLPKEDVPDILLARAAYTNKLPDHLRETAETMVRNKLK